MNIKKDLPIYVLSGAIVLSTLIYTNQSKSTDMDKSTPSTNSSYLTEEKYKSEMKIVLTEIVNLNGRMKTVEGCLSDTTKTLTQRNQVTTWCP
jgi:hypothetical protein